MATSVYTTEPAHPVLAHSLLHASPDDQTRPTESTTGDSDWSLRDDWEAGIQASSSGVFRFGNVIGFSRLRTRVNNNDEYIAQVSFTPASDISPSHSQQIPRYLLVKHLHRAASSAEPSTFIIYPESFNAFAPMTLLKELQNGQPGLSQSEAMKRLDSVQLFPIHHFSTAVQAIGQIAEQLQKHQEQQREPNDPLPGTSPVLLIVAGLDTLAEGIIRASNPLKGTAVLASTLRTLNRMARAHSSFLSVLLVNTGGLGPSHLPDQPEEQKSDNRPSRDDGIYSIFQPPGSSLLSTMLMRTLDQGTDTHILLSDVKSAHVAEVIKDRNGTGLGKWGLWSTQR